jgi:hypothetical protein
MSASVTISIRPDPALFRSTKTFPLGIRVVFAVSFVIQIEG